MAFKRYDRKQLNTAFISSSFASTGHDPASPSPEQYDQMGFADLIRSGNEQSLLLGDWPQWKTYRDMRAKTSHTYAEHTALEVVKGIAGFLAEAEFLLGQLRARAL